MITLNTTKRDTNANINALRGKAMLPGVVYGKKTESTGIAVSMSDFKRAWKKAGESTVITLMVGDESHDVLIHDVDIHPVSDEPIHVDFYALEKGQTVTVTIPVEFTGESPAEKNLGAVLVKVVHEIEVEAEAANLPHEIVVDISALSELDSKITIADIPFGAGVTPTADPEDIVILATLAKEEEEQESEEEADISSIEVEEKGKKEEGEEVPDE